jgi:hypothetical protein
LLTHWARRFRSWQTSTQPLPEEELRATLPLAGADVWIVVLNWNRRAETLACLASLERAAMDGATVVVVDNGSRDGSVDAVHERFPRVRMLALAENRGFAGGCNAGMRMALEAGAGAVLLLNNDTEVAPDFLEPLLFVLNANPRAAAVAGAVFRADSPAVLDVAWLDIYFGHGIVRRRGVNALPGEGFDQARPISAGVGSFLLLRARALARVGLLDEAYFAYHEEVDWCFRAARAGYTVMYQPWARLWHRGSSSTAVRTGPPLRRRATHQPDLPNPIPLPWNPVRTYLGARNSVRFVCRHGSWRRKLYFLASSLYAVPLDVLAVTMGAEEDVKLGLWTYRRALFCHCLDFDPRLIEAPLTMRTVLRVLWRAPHRLLVQLPRDVRRAHADGRTAEVVECVRGLRDGVADRPLPLERLGLR